MSREPVYLGLGKPRRCTCGATVRERHGVPFVEHEGGPWRLDPDTGVFHRPGVGWGTHRVHRCATPPPAQPAAQMTLELASWQ